MSKRQGALGMLISLVVVGLVLVTTSGCDSAGAGGSSDPILSVAPISVPTFATMNGVTTGSVGVASFMDGLTNADDAYESVNNVNNSNLVRYPNALLSAIQNRVRAGLSTSQPFTFTGTSTQGSVRREIRGTVVKSSANNRTYIAYYDGFEYDGDNETQNQDDVALVISFSPDYSVLYVTGFSSEHGRMIVEHDYDGSESIVISEDTSEQDSEGWTFYDMQHFQKSGSELTYRKLVYNDEREDLSESAVMHMIAGTGIIHKVNDGDSSYLTTTGGVLDDNAAEETLDLALSDIQDATADDDPWTEFNARTTVIPDYTSAEYTAAKAAHQAFYPDH